MSEYEPVWQLAGRHRMLTAAGIILAGLIGTGAVAGMRSDLDPSNQTRKRDAGDEEIVPEDENQKGIFLEEGVEAILPQLEPTTFLKS